MSGYCGFLLIQQSFDDIFNKAIFHLLNPTVDGIPSCSFCDPSDCASMKNNFSCQKNVVFLQSDFGLYYIL